MDSCRFRQKLVVLVTFLIFKWWSSTRRKISCVLIHCHWHMVLMLSRPISMFLALSLEHLGILTLLSSSPAFFPSLSPNQKNSQSQRNNTQTQLTITSVEKSSTRYQFLKSLSKMWELPWMSHYRSAAFHSGVFYASSRFVEGSPHVGVKWFSCGQLCLLLFFSFVL